MRRALWVLLGLVMCLAVATWVAVEPPSLSLQTADAQRFQVLDRHGEPLGISYRNRFNMVNIVPLHAMPEFLRQAFVTAEDRQFFTHSGVDWKARIVAVWQDVRAHRSVRGASTISEQVVRILHPRPRRLWSRWVEGFEALWLEQRAGKGEILEFYLNQVPYAANRRGVAQAARYYFNRDLETLTRKEMLALAVLPRAPSALDLYQHPDAIEPAVGRLAAAMVQRGEMSEQERGEVVAQKLALEPPPAPLNASHFIGYIRETVPYHLSSAGMLPTTLDAEVQNKAQQLLDERLKELKRKHVLNGAVLVVDHVTGEIQAWAVGGANDAGREIDAVRTPRQPGSAMKPFLYALALDSGWSPATQLTDAPMAEAIGAGLHDFHNYSHMFYGKVSLREALGNSLNIPALETIGFVTPERYLDTLHKLGFVSLTQPAEFYKDGLALGNGEVTLFEMVQAYAALAHRGTFRPLTPLPQPPFLRENMQVYSPEAASLVANIISDPFARRREFGAGSVLNLPVQTAVKTGTSTDYHDAWVMGFNARYVVGVWMGNLDNSPMDGITGSIGPALVLRGIFAELTQRDTPRALYLSPKLMRQDICIGGDKHQGCYPRTEYFMPGTGVVEETPAAPSGIVLTRPTEGLQMAYDPRLPPESQAFEFVAEGVKPEHRVEWVLNGTSLATTPDGHLLWKLKRGHYTLQANETGADAGAVSQDVVHFNVK